MGLISARTEICIIMQISGLALSVAFSATLSARQFQDWKCRVLPALSVEFLGHAEREQNPEFCSASGLTLSVAF